MERIRSNLIAVPATANERLGRKVTTSTAGEKVEAFVPPPLPPVPPLRMAELYGLLEGANRAIGRLQGVSSVLPGTPLFLYMYVRKEALLSSQIEGTQSSLSDLLLHEDRDAPGAPVDADVEEVSNYVNALNHGLDRLDEGLPVSVRLVRELHEVLLRGGRGSAASPGEFRRSQNWIGGTRPGNARFVPPPPELVVELMSDLERFIHDATHPLPLLLKIGLVHVQFETIHPFLDGNGRLGRLLITLLLCSHDVLDDPLLYLSLYFKTHRDEYYDLLQSVRTRGDWEAWLTFFLEGIVETADQAADTATDLLDLFDRDRRRIEALGRPAGSALRVHQIVQERPFVSVPAAAKRLGLSRPTVARSVEHLEKLGVLHEVTGRRWGRTYAYREFLHILETGTEPIGG
ncbi:MAG: Fic family protein [Gammaproteobacteria bacterium]|nr:Fic family protein [Gammaproteobacteria bacterium]